MSLRGLYRFVGGRVLAWLAAGAMAGAALGLVELAIASFLLLFLESLGLSPFVAARPAWLPPPLTLGATLVALSTIAAVRGVAHYVASQSGYESQLLLDARLRRLLVHRLLAPGATVPSAADVHRHLADTFPRAASAASQASAFVSAGVQALVIAVLMLVASPTEALAGLVGLLAVGGVVLAVHRRVRRIADAVPAEQRALHRGIERVARNFVLVRALGTEPREHARLASSIDGYAREARRASRLVSIAYAATPLFGTLLLVAILWLGRAVVHTEGARLVAFFYLYVRFVQTLAAVVRTATGTAQSWPQLREADALVAGLDASARIKALGPIDAGGSARNGGLEGAPSVELEGVRFRYPGATSDVLDDVSIALGAGEQLGVVGPSGAGKTTLLMIVLGLIEPDAGTVRVAGRAPAELWSEGRTRIGYVGAEPYLVAGTLRENLAYARPTAPTDEAAWAALSAVKLDEVVRARPGGLDTRLDEAGGGFSAGEQRRIALARALLADPLLLVLDEVSANLDAALEADVAEAVRALRGRCTTLVVSHRPAMLAHADRTITLG